MSLPKTNLFFSIEWGEDFIQGLLKKNEKKLVRSFNCSFCYTYDAILSLHNSKFGDFIYQIYPIELEIEDTINIPRSVSYFDLHLEIA
jgi:hypothetical protein